MRFVVQRVAFADIAWMRRRDGYLAIGVPKAIAYEGENLETVEIYPKSDGIYTFTLDEGVVYAERLADNPR